MNEKSVLVLGGTGFYGRHIVKSLVTKKVRTKVLSRNANQARTILGESPEIVEGDVMDLEVINKSLHDVKAVVICLSAMKSKLFRKMKAIERNAVINILDACQKAGIKRVVYTSGYEMRPEILKKLKIEKFGAIKIEIEKTLKNSNFNWTILGCAPSFELFFAFLKNNKMTVPGGGLKPIPSISAIDVGKIAAQTILRDDLSGKRFRLTGPEAMSFPIAAEHISKLTGKKIKHTKIPLAIIKIVSIIVYPFNPFVDFLYQSLKLLNNFPEDLTSNVPADHKILMETFNYKPVSFNEEIRSRLLSNDKLT